MKPCDCKDELDCKKLKERGLKVNYDSITVKPSQIILTIGPLEIKIPQYKFEKFAKWYLEDQG